MTEVSIEVVKKFFIDLQDRIVGTIEELDGGGKFLKESFDSPNGGVAQPRVLTNGDLFEKAAVQFSYSVGDRLPSAATERYPNLANCPFRATAISVIVHPRNPNVPTTHLNLRMFLVEAQELVWFFGGGFDLTPYILFEEDISFWHEQARAACGSDARYVELKENCDQYFYLPHRDETRGVGGIFFDDFNTNGFDDCFKFVKIVGETFLHAYTTIVHRRAHLSWTSEEEEWMLMRRGRYAEFNLAIDRGTKYGMQSGRRIESVLASLPPRVLWPYQHDLLVSAKFANLTSKLQRGIDWLGIVDNSVDKS
ncbi:MAG: oxygen-dependent coproporphyrinogen oxidase [Gammaproteobacteria bacterium]|nr:oxygen-dependent coproporphyrinogen oxidase [Gammaproteobacteria bacterium]